MTLVHRSTKGMNNQVILPLFSSLKPIIIFQKYIYIHVQLEWGTSTSLVVVVGHDVHLQKSLREVSREGGGG